MTKLKTFSRAHPVLAVVIIVLVVGLGGVAWGAVSMMQKFAPVEVDFSVPEAPQLTPSGPDETVYRIDASQSSVTYEVTETLAGDDHSATGTTHGIAGDILINDADLSASQVGEVVVDVKQLTSDQSMRDNRIRHEFLQSEQYPLVTYETTSIDGMPESITDGTDYEVTLHGDLTVKETTQPVDLSATARREGDNLEVTATAEVKLSDFDAGPISIIGVVKTGDDAKLSFDLVATDAATYQAPEQVDPAAPEYASGGPSFSKTVQPVIERSCASCHQPDGAGSNEWTVDDAGDVADYASGLEIVTQTDYMPPWPASDVGIPLKHSLKLSEEDKAAIKAWADAGGPLDVDPSTKIEPDDQALPSIRHDLDLTLPEPYQGTVEKQNDYRCFLLDPGFTDPTVVTGYEFEPDQVGIVHHALVYRLSGDARQAIEEKDASDPGSGWECFGGINVRGTSVSPSGSGGGSDLVMGYAPGQVPSQFPDGTGMSFDAGDVFVVQMHYHVTSDPPPDRSGIALQLAPDDPSNYDSIKVTTYLAPAEIPCLPQDAAAPLCDRNAELDELFNEYGYAGPSIANGLHLLCGTTPEELSVLDDKGVARSSCDHVVRNDGQIIAVLGHMHEIGLSYRMILNPGTPDEKILLDIPRWDFDWQFNYAPVDDITLKKGDVIRVECSWDRNLFDAGAEPHFVTWAEGTEDEMCFSTVATRESKPSG